MSDRTGRASVRSAGFGHVLVPIQITFGATGAVSTQTTEFGGVTVVRAAAGRYTFTFANPFRGLLGLMAGAHDYQGTATDGQWQIYTGYATAGTVSLSHTVAGSEADPASGNVVDLVFCMSNTDL